MTLAVGANAGQSNWGSDITSLQPSARAFMFAATNPSNPADPKPVDRRPRREQIVGEATRLFAERGYEGASMADVAASVGMRKASLFYHFATKDDLYAAVMKGLLSALTRALSSALAGEGGFSERLDRLSDAVFDVLSSEPNIPTLLLRESMDRRLKGSELGREALSALGFAEQFFLAGQSAGVFRRGDPKQWILSLASMHFLPMALRSFSDDFLGDQENRRVALRQQVRAMLEQSA